MKFPYLITHGVLRPIIPIILKRDDQSLHTEALVDSGADVSLFHAEFAKELGINDNLTDGEPVQFSSISGAPVRAYRHPVSIEVGGVMYFEIKLAFSEDISPDSYNILGQADFFDWFPVKFTYSKKEIELMTRSR